MTTAQLTPQTNQTPAVANLSNELSGPQWVPRFPGSSSTTELAPVFRANVEKFIEAMRAAGMTVVPASTYRPPQRSYLMRWCWKIVHGTDPTTVPPMAGVAINWVHPTMEASTAAARQMTIAYQIAHLEVAPALHSLHNVREAIDMRVSWTGNVSIVDASGATVLITTSPRTGMNPQLKIVGASYGVKKFVGGASDKPHWSTTGH